MSNNKKKTSGGDVPATQEKSIRNQVGAVRDMMGAMNKTPGDLLQESIRDSKNLSISARQGGVEMELDYKPPCDGEEEIVLKMRRKK